jgi:hypothetical protein
MNIYLDLETIPAQRPEILDLLQENAQEEKQTVKAPSNYKDEAKINEYIAAKCAEIDAGVEEKYRKTALDGSYGQVCVIGYAVNDDPVRLIYCDDWADEARLLHAFNTQLSEIFDPNNRGKFIGHNILGFDLPFLHKRYIVAGIKPSPLIPFDARPYSEFIFDTMTQWAGYGNRISLDRLGRALSLGGKGDFNGSMVWDAIKNGEIERVAEYCAEDVELTRDIYKRMQFL